MRCSLRAMLAISLSLNFAFIGAATAIALKHGERGRESRYFSDIDDIKGVSPEVSDAFKEAIASVRADAGDIRKQARAERNLAIDALVSEPADVEKFRLHSDKADAVRGEMKKGFRDAIADLATRLSPQKRQELGELLRNLRYGGRRGDNKGR